MSPLRLVNNIQVIRVNGLPILIIKVKDTSDMLDLTSGIAQHANLLLARFTINILDLDMDQYNQ